VVPGNLMRTPRIVPPSLLSRPLSGLPLLVAFAGCSLLPAQLRGSSSSSSAAPSGAGNDATSHSAAAAPAGDVDAQLLKMLGDEARYGASDVQHKPSVCPVKPGQRAVAVWVNGANARGEHDLECFTGDDIAFRSLMTATSAREVYDRHLNQTVGDDVATKDKLAILVTPAGPTGPAIWGFELGAVDAMIKIPLKPGVDISKLSRTQLFAKFAEVTSTDQAIAQVLTRDRASAMTADLAATRTRLLTETAAYIKSKAAEWAKQEAEELAKVTFPRPGMSDARLVKVVRDYMVDRTDKTDIDPKLVKKVLVTGTNWAIRHDDYGVIQGKVSDVTVGVARADARCAFVTLEVQKDYAGGGTYNEAPYVNGMQTGWTSILCDRIK